MKQPEGILSGYTKTQAILMSLFALTGTMSTVGATSAAPFFSNLQDAPLIGVEAIRAPENSIILLSDEEQEEKRIEREANREPDPAVATIYMTASAYNSVPGQTDGSPYKTAIGSLTRDGVIASNYFPIGTRIRIPDHFGDKEFRVEDRMNPRYSKTLDIWMEEISDAKQWGRRYVKVEVVKYGLGRGVE